MRVQRNIRRARPQKKAARTITNRKDATDHCLEGHSPELHTVDAATWRVYWVGLIARLYVALQARAVLAQPLGGVVHAIERSLDFASTHSVVVYAFVDWMRGVNSPPIFR